MLFKPFIQAGVVPAFRRSSNYTNFVNDEKEFEYARGRSITRFGNFSSLLGAGVEYQLEKRTAFAGFYYMRGLKSVIKDSDLKDTFGKRQSIASSSIRFLLVLEFLSISSKILRQFTNVSFDLNTISLSS